MARDFIINGETLVKVKGMGALSQDPTVVSPQPKLWELGLAADDVRVIPRFHHKDVMVDDFGPEVPAEVIWMLAEVGITMTLVHYDRGVLDRCLAESMGGWATGVQEAGTLTGMGTLMGGGRPRFSENCHFISLNLLSPVLAQPWRFPTAYLAGLPAEVPLGTKRSLVRLNWRAVPYRPFFTTADGTTTQEIKSAGAVLWDREADT